MSPKLRELRSLGTWREPPIEIRRKRGVLHIVPEPRPSVWDSLERHDVFPDGAFADIDQPWPELWDGEPELYDDSLS